MKQEATGKALRAVLIAAVLVVAVGGGAAKISSVNAKSCDEAWVDYLNAEDTYESARLSRFYGIPTTCQQDCQGDSNPVQCAADCQTNRQTALGNAEIGLFSLALDTCTPVTVDQCAQARG